jgi:hypothetical protein
MQKVENLHIPVTFGLEQLTSDMNTSFASRHALIILRQYKEHKHPKGLSNTPP